MAETWCRLGPRAALALSIGTMSASVFAGCGGDTAPPEFSTVTDSAGIRIVEVPPLPNAPAAIRVSDQPVYRIGWDDRPHLFESLRDGALLEDGTAVVIDGGRTQQVVLLSPAGSVEGLLGGLGEGPGEFTDAWSIVAGRGDTILVQDPRNGRLSKFTRNGFVESIRLDGLNLLHVHGMDPESGAPMLGMPLAAVLGVGRRYETPWLEVPLVRVDWTTARADTLGMAEWDQSIAVGGGNNPFMSGGFITVSDGDFVVARGDRPEVRWIDRAGALRQIVRWTAQPTEIPDTLIAGWESRRRAVFQNFGLAPADIEDRIASMKTAMQEPLPLFGIPGNMPGAGGLHADPDGNIWIAEYRAPGATPGPPQVFFVMSPLGEWLGAVSIPDGVRVLDIGSRYLLGVERNEYDVEAVGLYTLER